MKFLSYSTGGEASFGLAAEAGVIDLKSRLGVGSLKALIAAGGLGRAAGVAGEAPDHAWDAVTFLPVIPDPDKIICIGINYEEHRAETGRSAVAHPTVFTRFADTQVGHGQPIIKPKVSETVDYEGELAVVIGREARGVAEADALSHVAGFACYNDVSIRDFQRHTTQFTPGKNFPGTGPFGPYLVTPDEVGALGPQRIQTRLNGQVVQDSTLEHMIFDVPKLIAYLSLWTLLRPGDVIVTGTPGGVGAARTPPLWMKPGDEVEVEIDRVGLLKNRVAAEES
ncbi:MAG TPA: fumarylacetoacetate hydrolase family protein [Caulobacteraceae bacterium]|nr:fumarylacetoacetate hydrolase family protein [Caulobacteraceae bacterium]